MVADDAPGGRGNGTLSGGSPPERWYGDAGNGRSGWSWGLVHGQLGHGMGRGVVFGGVVVFVPAGHLLGAGGLGCVALFGGLALLDFG